MEPLQMFLSSIRLCDIKNGNSFADLLKNSLKLINLETYEEWKEDCYNLDHLFTTDFLCDSQETLLTIAAKIGAFDAVQILLDEGADVSIRNSNDCTPLHCASQCGHLQIVEILLKNGADVNIPIKQGCTPLYLASSEGYLEIVNILIKYGADLSVSTCDGETPLFAAVVNEHLETVSSLIDHGSALETANDTNMTPLLKACKQRKEILELLINKGGNIKSININGRGPLHIAALNNKVENIKLLLEKGADPNQVCEIKGFTSLVYAARMGHLDVVKFLVEEHNVNINHKNDKGFSALIGSVVSGNLHIVKYLLSKGADFSEADKILLLDVAVLNKHLDVVKFLIEENNAEITVDSKGLTLLHKACHSRSFDLVKYMVIEKKIDCKIRDNNGCSALHVAAGVNCSNEIIKFLILNGGYVNGLTEDELTPLDCAVLEGNLGFVKFLIEDKFVIIDKENKNRLLSIAIEGGDLEVIKYLVSIGADEFPNGCLNIAAEEGFLEIVKYLIDEQNFDFNAFSPGGYTPLYRAAMGSSLETVKYFVEEKHVNCTLPDDTEGWTALYLSTVKSDNIDIAKYLLEKGTDFEVRTVKGRTPVHGACFKGNLDWVKYFVEELNANLTNKDIFFHTPLDAAVEVGNFDVAKYLIEERGVDIYLMDISGRSILDLAVHSGNLDMVKYLIKEKHLTKFINWRRSDNKWTPLHVAASRGHLEIAEFLLSHGATLDSQDRYGNTPFQVAVRKGHTKLIELFKNCRGESIRKDYHFNSFKGGFNRNRENNEQISKRNLQLWEKSPLYNAVFNGKMDETKGLIEENLEDNLISLALSLSIKRGHLDITRYLIEEKGVDVNKKFTNGKNVLHLAVQSGNINMVKYLIEEKNLKQLINSRCDNRWTPLHEATSLKETIIIEYLLSLGAIVNSFDSLGNTCLHVASSEGYLEGAILFVNKGAKMNAKNNNGLTPLELATEKGQIDIVNFLKEKIKS